MPLIECPDCGQRVSDAAPSCLSCGRPIATAVATLRSGDVPAAYVPQPTMTRFRCGNCGSDQLRKLSVIFAGGISQVETQTSGLGFALGGGLGVGSARTTGVHQTVLSQAAAPPAPRKVSSLAILGILFGLAVLQTYAKAVGFLIIAVCIWHIYNCRKYNKNVHPGLHARWERGYMCERCGQQTEIA